MMKQHIIQSRFGYRAEFKLLGGRKVRSENLNGIEPVAIDEIDAVDAPVAYRIRPERGIAEGYAIRSHSGALWWPLYELAHPISADRFLGLVSNDWQKAALILDPMNWTYSYLDPTHEERFVGQPLQEYRSDYDTQLASARWDASRVLIVGDQVHVAAGDPVWYATPDKAGNGFDLRIGCASLDRRNREHFNLPFPDRMARYLAASLGRAFGLDEIAHGVGWLAASEVRYRHELIDTGINSCRPAADLCVQAFAERLVVFASDRPDLCASIPALANLPPDMPMPRVLPHHELVRQFVALAGTPLAAAHAMLMDDAMTVLDRVGQFERVELSREEDDFVASLAVSA